VGTWLVTPEEVIADIKETQEHKKMGIFGDLDIDVIPDDPFRVEPGTYRTVCTDGKFMEHEGNHYLAITWQIDDPESKAHGNNVQKWYSLFPGVKTADLSPEQLKTLSFMKKMLREGFGWSEEDMKTKEPSELIGTITYLTVVENNGKGDKSDRVYTNVTKGLCEELYKENNAGVEAMTNDLMKL
jgi:hypothetical protein